MFDARAAPTSAASASRRRAGGELGDDNIWIIERRREIASLQAIIARLAITEDDSVARPGTGTAAAAADPNPRSPPIRP